MLVMRQGRQGPARGAGLRARAAHDGGAASLQALARRVVAWSPAHTRTPSQGQRRAPGSTAGRRNYHRGASPSRCARGWCSICVLQLRWAVSFGKRVCVRACVRVCVRACCAWAERGTRDTPRPSGCKGYVLVRVGACSPGRRQGLGRVAEHDRDAGRDDLLLAARHGATGWVALAPVETSVPKRAELEQRECAASARRVPCAVCRVPRDVCRALTGSTSRPFPNGRLSRVSATCSEPQPCGDLRSLVRVVHDEPHFCC